MSHDHEHEHVHEHGHGHEHHHHHGPAEELAEGALALSGSWTGRREPPIPYSELAEGVAAGLLQIAERLAEDGILYGHVKALLRCGECKMAFSVTRPGHVDKKTVGDSQPPETAGEWQLTVNVISLVNTEALTGADLEGYFPL